MIKYVFSEQLKKKNMIQLLFFFTFFMIIYFIIDYLNMPYDQMVKTYSVSLVVLNVFLNFLMSFLSALLFNVTTVMGKLKLGKTNGENLGFISILFGILTYGCTSCVIAFLGAIGISFSVIALPMAGLPYKLISVMLIVIGFLWVMYEVKKGVCKIK